MNLELGINSSANQDQSHRDKIVNAAYSCFEQHGFDKTTVGDIIARSGVSRAKFYKLYRNKEAVIIEICQRETQVSAEKVDRLWNRKNKSTEDILVERIFRVLKHVQENMYIRYLYASPGYMNLIVDAANSESTIFPLVKSRMESAYQPLVQRARNTTVSLEDVASQLTYSQAVLLKLLDNAEPSDAKLKQFIREFVAKPLLLTLRTD